MDSEKSKDFYGVLGLNKECTPEELRTAYKKLAMKWHPDRCSMAGNVKLVEEAKTKFQAIQEAYSVISDPNKRFLYDCGVYDCEDEDDNNGMGEFLNEMATMMNQNKPTGSAEENFAELQDLFEEIFQTDVDEYVSSSSTWIPASSCSSSSSSSFFPTQSFNPYKNAPANNNNSKRDRDSSHTNTTNGSENMMPNDQFEGFNIGVSFSTHFVYSIFFSNGTPNPHLLTTHIPHGATPKLPFPTFVMWCRGRCGVVVQGIGCDGGLKDLFFEFVKPEVHNFLRVLYVVFIVGLRQVGHQERARIRRGVQARGNEGRRWIRRDDFGKQKGLFVRFGHASRSSA